VRGEFQYYIYVLCFMRLYGVRAEYTRSVYRFHAYRVPTNLDPSKMYSLKAGVTFRSLLSLFRPYRAVIIPEW
jgi:hypothetical protein